MAQPQGLGERAGQVITLLQDEKVELLTKQFDSKLAAALMPEQLRDLWRALQAQIGPFKSVVDRDVRPASSNGFTSVTIGCQFEKAIINMVVVFDKEARIGGLRFVPREAAK